MNASGEHRAGERDEYFVRRLESFGDVVIGFSLALLGVSLAVPNHAYLLIRNYAWFIAYAWTFAFVCSIWASHYWTFRHVFVPTRLSLLLNYAKLGLIVLLIFGVQVLLRAFEFGNARDLMVANMLYWGCLTAYLVVAAALMAIGYHFRKSMLAPDVAKQCVRRIWRVAVMVPLILAGLAVALTGQASNAASTVAIFLTAGVAAGAVVSRIVTRTQARPP
jgi:uncharacterized membrane protein